MLYSEVQRGCREFIAKYLNVDVNDVEALIPFQFSIGSGYIYDYNAFKFYERDLISWGYKFISTELDDDGNTDYIYQTEPPLKYNYVTINPDGSRTKEPVYGEPSTKIITKLRFPVYIKLGDLYSDVSHANDVLGDIFHRSDFWYT